tara:strand:+ start:914 stop:1276 length:363 start_codon:yes stop_codon:yes gene_type:complete
MPNIASSDCLDTSSTDGNCLYPAKALGGSPHTSPNVYFENEQVEYYDSTSQVDNVDGVKINPVVPLPCQPGIRTIVPSVNTTVFINGKLPAVSGDLAQFPGTNRPLTGPYNYTTINIQNP